MTDINENTKLAESKKAIFRLLKYRPRSENEIRIKLRDKEFSPDIIQQTVEYFKKIGAINDQQFAIGWIRSRLNKPLGAYRIGRELRQKGIDDDMIAATLADASQDYDEDAAVVSLAQKRLKKYKAIDPLAARRRLYGYLARRGFSNGAIMKALNGIAKREYRNSK